MHCVRVVCFVKTVGLSRLRCWGAWMFTFLALHRQNQELKVYQTNGARIVHLGFECAPCSRCMCPISAFTGCGTFSVHLSLFPPEVKRKLFPRACPHRSVKIGLFKTLGFVLHCAVGHRFTLCLLQATKEEAHYTQDALVINRLGVVERLRVALAFVVPCHTHDAW